MKKRVISLCMALLMMVSLLPSAAFAADAVAITVGNATVEAGQPVTVDVSISGASSAAFAAVYLDFTYDQALTLTNAVLSDAATQAGFKIASRTGGNIQIDGNTSSGTSLEDGTLLTLTFDISENASGEYTIAVGYAANNANNVYDYQYNNVDCAFTAGTITVGASGGGDEVEGYAATVSRNSQTPSNVRVGNTILVDITVDDDFAATEMNITYNKDLVSLAESGHDLGTATLKDDKAGNVALADYGANKTGGTVSYILAFTANADGNAEFGISDDSRGFGTGDSAETANLTKAAKTTPVTITIAKKLYTVTLPNIFITDNNVTTVEDGREFTFKPENVNYNYENVSVTGTYTELVLNADGTWTIKGVGSDLTVSGSRTAKTFEITWEGNAQGEEGVTKPTGDATYDTDIVIIVPADQSASAGVNGWYYTVTAKYTESEETVQVEKNGTTHTIAGDAITADLTITITKNTSNFTDVTITLENATDVSINNVDGNTTTVTKGAEVTLVLDRKEGYTYVINVNNEDKTAEFSNNNEYTFAANENVTVTVTRNVDITGAEAAKYVKLEGADMWLVKVSPELTNSHYTYDGVAMFWSEQYNANCVLVIVTEDTYTVDTKKFDVATGAATTVDYSGDVNMADPEGSLVTIDANDAQLVYNMYNAKYSDFSNTVTMEKFLRADMSTTPIEGVDYMINVNDAATIINMILNPNT